MDVEIGTEAAQFLFLGIVVSNFRYCVFAVQYISVPLKKFHCPTYIQRDDKTVIFYMFLRSFLSLYWAACLFSKEIRFWSLLLYSVHSKKYEWLNDSATSMCSRIFLKGVQSKKSASFSK